jgi:hypothetical protein
MTQRLSSTHTLQDICRFYHELYDQTSLLSSSQDEPEEQQDVPTYLQTFWSWLMSRLLTR